MHLQVRAIQQRVQLITVVTSCHIFQSLPYSSQQKLVSLVITTIQFKLQQLYSDCCAIQLLYMMKCVQLLPQFTTNIQHDDS